MSSEKCQHCSEHFYRQSLVPLEYVDLTFCGEKLNVIGCYVEPSVKEQILSEAPKICRTCLELLGTTFSDNNKQTLTNDETPKKKITQICAFCLDAFPVSVMMSMQLTIINYEGLRIKLVDCYKTCAKKAPSKRSLLVCLACISTIAYTYRKHKLNIPFEEIKLEPFFADSIQHEQLNTGTKHSNVDIKSEKDAEIYIDTWTNENDDCGRSESLIESSYSTIKRHDKQKSTTKKKIVRLAPDDEAELLKSLIDPYECSFCKDRFRIRVTLIEHMKKHRSEKRQENEKTKSHSCSICNRKLASKFRLKRHLINSHYKSNTYECHHCPEFRTLTKANLEEHLLMRHFDIEQKCPDCSVVMPNRRTFLKHIKQHQLPNQLQCPLCKRCFATAQQYRRHVKTNKTVIGCKQCEAAFHSVRSLDTHMQIVHDWVFTCEVCKLPLANRQNYNIHLRVQHSVYVKPSCKYCAQEFETTGDMMAHQKNEHEYQNYICETCGKNFNTSVTMRTHVSLKHKRGLEKVKEKCRLCGKVLGDKKSVERHIKRIHTNDFPRKLPKLIYTCPQCPQWKFVRHQHLEGHMIVHNTENRRFFPCFNCGIAYTRRQKFDFHAKKCFAAD